jgi:hypothetical protein
MAIQSMPAMRVFEMIHLKRVDELNMRMNWLESLKRIPTPEKVPHRT